MKRLLAILVLLCCSTAQATNRTDDFNRANGNLNGSTPSGGGGTWTATAGATIVSNAAQTSGSPTTAYLESSTADVEVQATITVEGSNAALLFRASDADNHLGLYVIDNYVHLIKRVAGSVTQDPLSDGSGTSTADNPLSAGDVFKVRCNGNTITVFKNGAQIMERTGVTFNNTATKHGFYKDGGGSPSWDDFSITDYVVASMSADRDKVLCGSGTTVVTLTGIGTAWTGTPFSLDSEPTGWSIASQNVISGTSATVTLNKGSGTGAFDITDGSVSDSVTATNTATSIANGNWATAATWDVAEAPVTGNLAVIAHDVTVAATAAIGNSPAEGNVVLTINAGDTLLVADGDTLTVKGEISIAGTLQVGETSGGGTLIMDAGAASSPLSQQYKIALGTAGIFRTRGTSGSKSVVQSDSDGGNAYIQPGTDYAGYDLEYCQFTRIGDSTNNCIDNISNANPVSPELRMDIADCEFTDCGRVGSSNGFSANAGVSIVRCKFISGEHATDDVRLTASTPEEGVTRLVNLCSFEKAFYWTEGMVTVTNNVLDGEGGGLSGTGNWEPGQFDGNFFRMISTSGGGIVGMMIRGNCDECYFLPDAGTNNPHGLLPGDTGEEHTVSDCIYEYTRGFTDDTGDWFYGGGEWIVERCIVLPAGGAVTPSGALNMPEGVGKVRHCTLACGGGYAGGFLLGDGNSMTGSFTEVKSNLFWAPLSLDNGADTRAVTDVAGGLAADDVITPANCVYNGLINLNIATPYQGEYPTTQPGANDVVANAVNEFSLFVDPSRNIATWAVSRGSVAATYLDKVADARSYLRADPTLIPDLMAHVRGGFAPKYAPLENAGHDAVTIGAVEGVFGGAKPHVYYYQGSLNLPKKWRHLDRPFCESFFQIAP